MILIYYYPPSSQIDFFRMFPDFWGRLLVHVTDSNWLILFLLIVAGSYAFGFLFIGFYDFIGVHIVRRSSRAFARASKFLLEKFNEWKDDKDRGWYYWENKITPFDGKQNNEYEVGKLEYAELMSWLYHPKNNHLRDYYWEFLKTVSSRYLASLIFL